MAGAIDYLVNNLVGGELAELNVRSKDITEDEFMSLNLEELSQLNSTVRILRLHTPGVTDKVIARCFACELIDLEEVDFTETKITGDGLRELLKLTNLKKLVLYSEDEPLPSADCLENLIKAGLPELRFLQYGESVWIGKKNINERWRR